MKLDDIVKDIFTIVNNIANSTMFDKRLVAQKKRAAADLISSSIQPFVPCVKNNSTPSRSKIKQALRNLEEISKTYQIEELKKPIKDMKAYLDSLG